MLVLVNRRTDCCNGLIFLNKMSKNDLCKNTKVCTPMNLTEMQLSRTNKEFNIQYRFTSLCHQNTLSLHSSSGLFALHLTVRQLSLWMNNVSVVLCGAASSYWLIEAVVREMNDTALTAGELQTLNRTEGWLWLDDRTGWRQDGERQKGDCVELSY